MTVKKYIGETDREDKGDQVNKYDINIKPNIVIPIYCRQNLIGNTLSGNSLRIKFHQVKMF